MSTVYLLVGSPGVGKSTLMAGLRPLFHVLDQDEYIGNFAGYISDLTDISRGSDKPVLANTPFSVSQPVDALRARGVKVVPVFIIEAPDVLTKRYLKREGKAIPPGHLTRQVTYQTRARELGAFIGTAEQVLKHLETLRGN